MTLFLHALRRMRGQILAFGLGLAVWGALYVFLFPVVQDSMSNVDYPQEILSAFGAGGSDLGDPRLFFDVEFFSLAPSITAVFAVIAGTGALAGEESAGTIEFLAALPLSRRRIFAQKALALIAGAVLVATLTALGWFVTAPFAEYRHDLPVLDIIGGTFLQVPYVLFVAATALLLGAVAPSRSAAAAWCGGLIVVQYLIVVIGALTASLEWIRYLSPYYYTDLPGVLEDGVTPWHQGVLFLMIVVCLAAALRAFEGRELRGGRWQWGALFAAGPTSRGVAVAAGESPVIEEREPEPRRLFGMRPPSSRGGWIALAVVVAIASVALGIGVGALEQYGLRAARTATITASGRVDADGAGIFAPTTGVVHATFGRRGDDVKRGQVLAWVTSAVDGSEQPIVAPLDGSLTEWQLSSGQNVVVGTPIGQVHQVGRLRAVLEVNEQDLKRLVSGQPVDVQVTALGIRIATQIDSVSTVPISEVGQGRTKPKYEVWCPLPEPDGRIVIGMRVEGTIQAAR